MTARNLDKIFEPENVAVIGATEREESVGLALMKNLSKKPEGKIFPVNPNRDSVLDIESYPSVKKISDPVDLGVVATPPKTVPGIVEECGEASIPALIIITAGFGETGGEGKKLAEQIERIRRDYGIRILGPNCLGIINPHEDLNASFTEQMPEPGKEVFLSQSGALASSILDWAISAQFGFRAYVSLGNMLDVDFSDLIDYFGKDPKAGSILMYIESINDSQKFMSAARRSARAKPLLAVKSGRSKEGAKAVASHTGSLSGSDEVYSAAFKRAGIVRVDTIDDLFTTSELLAKENLPEGPNLAIVTNAGGPGAMASDSIVEQGGKLADLSDSTRGTLSEVLPERASLANPVDITGDASKEMYRKSAQACLKDKNVDGLLCIYAPVWTLSSVDAAEAIADLKGSAQKPILASWMGGETVQKGRDVLRDAGIPVQSAPEQSVKNYMYLNRYARKLEGLLEMPEELQIGPSPPKYHLKAMIERTARQGRGVLTEEESKKILHTFGIPSPEIHVAESPEEAARYASEIGFPVVLKIRSHDVTHKKAAGGVVLNLNTESEVKEEFNNIIEKVGENRPMAEIDGVTVQKMIRNKDIELILGSKKDPVFKSILLFGRGGSDVEYIGDTSIGFPPLNQTLAQRLMEDTDVYEQLIDFDSPELIRSLEEHLVRLSQLIIEFPEIRELDINPLAKVGDEFMALDASIIIDLDTALSEPKENDHLAIAPYPQKYTEDWRMEDGRSVTIRPIRSEDEPLAFDLFDTFSEETQRYRFFGPMKDITHEEMVRFTNIDYRREVTMIGELEEEGKRKMIGMCRLLINPDESSGEFAPVVGDPWQGLGLGEKLVDSIIGIAKDKDLDSIYVIPRKENERMINLCRKLGFEIEEEDEETVRATLEL